MASPSLDTLSARSWGKRTEAYPLCDVLKRKNKGMWENAPILSLWHKVVAALLACSGALVFLFKWFLLATDVTVSYGWTHTPGGSYPNFDIRNQSGSRTYLLGNIVYKNGGSVRPIIAIDNKSFWEQELKPGSVRFFRDVVDPVASITTSQQCLETKVYVRLQNSREIRAQGPGQPLGRFWRMLLWLRQKLNTLSVPVD
jgi:hypothetical protein